MCPICKYRLVEFNNPIKYWGCPKCESVFVLDRNGIFQILNLHVRYENNREKLLYKTPKSSALLIAVMYGFTIGLVIGWLIWGG